MAKLTDASGRPMTGIVSYAVMAVVVDNVDPQARGRVRVKYPTLAGEPRSAWLRQVTPAGGKGFGLYSLPEVGDEVLVVFLQGSQDAGIIVGSLWNGETAPPSEAEGGPSPSDAALSGASASTAEFTAGSANRDANDRRFWRSRAGHLLAFDDTDGSESVQIWDGTHAMSLVFDAASASILLTNTGADLHIRTAGDLYLEAGGKIIFAAGGDLEGSVGGKAVVEVGSNLEVSAGADLVLEASANAELTAGANLSLQAGAQWNAKGVQATLEGSAKVTVKGGAMAEVTAGIVKIN